MTNSSGFAITSLIFGVLSVLLGWIPLFGFIISLPAMIFGIMALVKIRKEPQLKGKVMAIIGIVLGTVFLLFQIFIFIGTMAFIGMIGSGKLKAEICTISPKIDCLSARYAGSGIEMTVQNLQGYKMSDVVMSIDGEGCKGNSVSGSSSIEDKETAAYFFSCSPPEGMFSGEVQISHINAESGMAHTDTGFVTVYIT